MPQQLINLGTNANDGTGDSLRAAGSKINSNFTELYAKPAYTLPPASQTTLGGVKIGSTLQINQNTSLLDLNSNLNDLNDVTIQNVGANQVLKYDGTKWINSNLPPAPVQLDDLTNVNLTSVSDGQYLKYNGTEWVNSSFFELHLNTMSDVTLTSPTTGQFLKYDGNQWINAPLPPTTSLLNDLTDVTITSPTVGQVLKWNGTQWVNGTDAGQTGNPFNQSLNTTDNVQFNSTSSAEYILNGAGVPSLQSPSDIYISAVGKVKIITRSPMQMATMTTAQRDALTNVENGDVIYNTSTNKFQGRAAGVWVDLH